MMGTSLKIRSKWAIMSKIPTKLTEKQFKIHIEPHLSKAKRGFACQIPLYKVFNYILYWLHTGCQWEQLPIELIPDSEKKKLVTVPSISILCSGAAMGA